ncbi:tetratricopeptide repeat protein [Chryseobacterium terrae]|uniref:Tetratricopeptide repeat-containing protein n=1 Tax=Chryseobacterium terrae TaxID=3163299 RepID=A0ABW8Y1M2_9FLAO
MKKITLLLILLLFSLAPAQNVFKSQKQIYLAEYYTHLKNDKKALDCYLKAINFNSKTNSYDYLKAASIAFKLKKNKTAKELLTQSITKQLAPFDFLKEFENLQPYKDSKEMKEVLAQYDDLENQYFRELKHPKAYMEIQNLIATDQLIRKEQNVFLELTDKVDSENIAALIELTKKFGWEDRAWMLLWHHRGYSDEQKFVWDFFKPYLENEIKKDNVNKDFFVDFEEFENSMNDIKNKTSSGSIYTLNTLGNMNNYISFFDIKNLDKRRKSVGLPPLYFEYFLNNISKLPEGYEYNPENLLKDLENL